MKHGNYPTGLDSVTDFETQSVPESVWERLHKDLNLEMEHSANSRLSNLSHERQ